MCPFQFILIPYGYAPQLEGNQKQDGQIVPEMSERQVELERGWKREME